MADEAARLSMGLEMRAAWAQIPGTREYQEDHAVITRWPNGYHLMILADGMGGHLGGAQASRIVVETMRDHFLTAMALPYSEEGDPGNHALVAALQACNTAIFHATSVDPRFQGMGSTVVAATFDGEGLQWISVGDSPLYLFRKDRLVRLNSNHSMAAVLAGRVAAGELTSEQAANAPDRSELLAAVMGEDIPLLDEPNVVLPMETGDIVLLASDGIEILGKHEMTALLQDHVDAAPEDIVDALLAQVDSLERIGKDNTTVIAARIDEIPSEMAATR